MQVSGNEEIRIQLQPSKPKREITNITNSENSKKTYGQPSESLVKIFNEFMYDLIFKS